MRTTSRLVTIGLVTGAIALASTASAVAAPALPSRYELRQLIQRDHIDDAVRDGRLTSEHAAALNAEQDTIADRERSFRVDGVFTPREAAVLDHLLDAASRRIDRALAAPKEVAGR